MPAVLHTTAHVLIVDDDPAYRHLVAGVVADLLPEAHVDAVEDAWQARWARDRSRGPLLILSDHRMPGETGLELLMAFHRDRRPGEHLVLLTSFLGDDSLAHALDAGIDDVLHKPARIDDLEILLAGCIEAWGRRVAAAHIHV